MKRRKKLCFAASSGGHFEEIMMLRPLMDRYESIITTEGTKYDIDVEGIKTYYLLQVNRREPLCAFRLVVNSFRSLKIMLKEKPDAVICTGALATIPLCLLSKLFGKKLIYIESFANVTYPSRTGKLLYKYADEFYVQWPPMKQIYPNATFLGGIY